MNSTSPLSLLRPRIEEVSHNHRLMVFALGEGFQATMTTLEGSKCKIMLEDGNGTWAIAHNPTWLKPYHSPDRQDHMISPAAKQQCADNLEKTS
uniref:Uncharacterized protein n=1 Tax=Rhizophora mucronata TaxID=61149 RepID=A0A2P2N5P6_RHIMU